MPAKWIFYSRHKLKSRAKEAAAKAQGYDCRTKIVKTSKKGIYRWEGYRVYTKGGRMTRGKRRR